MSDNSQEKILDISWGTIAKVSVALSAFYILYLIRDILIWFLFALVLTVLFNPAIDFLQKKGIPRPLAVILCYFVVFGFLGFVIYLTIPVFITEIYQFSQLFPQYFEKIAPPLQGLGIEAFENFEIFIKTLGEGLRNMAANIFSALFSIFGGLVSTMFIITVAIFVSLEQNVIERGILLLFPKKYESFAVSLWEKTQQKVSGWFLIKVLGSVLVGVASYIAFIIFDIKYPFTLALASGALNFIPIVGPLIAGLAIFLLVSMESLFKAVFILIFFVILQQVEGNILTPILSEKFIKLSPALVLISLAIGGKLFGIWGAVLFVPLFGIVFEFLRDFLRRQKEERATIL
ncbi:MAG: AI-2E family transporter [Candidatus Nealsonbacteria bacterium]|nr:AI-2E family transporter [Candidatus Nealsonbacteria bacterium]